MPSFHISFGGGHGPRFTTSSSSSSHGRSRPEDSFFGDENDSMGFESFTRDFINEFEEDMSSGSSMDSGFRPRGSLPSEFSSYGGMTERSRTMGPDSYVEERVPAEFERPTWTHHERQPAFANRFRSPSPPSRIFGSDRRRSSSPQSTFARGRSPDRPFFMRETRSPRSPSPFRALRRERSPSPTHFRRGFGYSTFSSTSTARPFGRYNTFASPGTDHSGSSFRSNSTVRPRRRPPSPLPRRLAPSPPRRRSPSPHSVNRGGDRNHGIGLNYGRSRHPAESAAPPKTDRRQGRSFRTEERRPADASSRGPSTARHESSRRHVAPDESSRSCSGGSRADSSRSNSRSRRERARSPPSHTRPSPPRPEPRSHARPGTSAGSGRSHKTEERRPERADPKPFGSHRFEGQAPGSHASVALARSRSELKKMFDTYDAKWVALGRVDKRYPLPTSERELFKLDFAGGSRSNLGNFSGEAVMIANVQLIFLAGFGISGSLKKRSDGLDVVVEGKSQKEAEVKSLIKWLNRKEQPRWHPDRMNLRTGVDGRIDESISKKADVVAMRTAAQRLLETLG